MNSTGGRTTTIGEHPAGQAACTPCSTVFPVSRLPAHRYCLACAASLSHAFPTRRKMCYRIRRNGSVATGGYENWRTARVATTKPSTTANRWRSVCRHLLAQNIQVTQPASSKPDTSRDIFMNGWRGGSLRTLQNA